MKSLWKRVAIGATALAVAAGTGIGLWLHRNTAPVIAEVIPEIWTGC